MLPIQILIVVLPSLLAALAGTLCQPLYALSRDIDESSETNS